MAIAAATAIASVPTLAATSPFPAPPRRNRVGVRCDREIPAGENVTGEPSASDQYSSDQLGEPVEQSASEIAHQNEAHADDAPGSRRGRASAGFDRAPRDEHDHEPTRRSTKAWSPRKNRRKPITPANTRLRQKAANSPRNDNGNGANVHENIQEHSHDEEEEVVDTVGGSDAMEEVAERAPRYRRQYKIQEVIKQPAGHAGAGGQGRARHQRRGAHDLSPRSAGRYCVLMPNTARGGGISRKITSADDRKKLREIAEDLEVPEGMGVILRTARRCPYQTGGQARLRILLLRIWEQVRDLTLKSTAPTLVYEEGSLAKRSIRDLYSKDIDEIVVAGEQGYKDAKEFMRMLMPSHAKNVKHYADSQPVFTRYGIESQLDAMFTPTVQLRSGGYIVINQTEALVAIDVNSGRSTREHHIEDTALKTNVEASEEVARQLRLRDLAGLIVIDFIDMDEKRNNRTVERRLKDALRHDRARIQVGRISHFRLMEMSRQRIRTSVLLESSTEKCPHCGGTGHIRSVSSVALQLLRGVEEMLLKGPTHNLIIRTRPEIALYVLNNKREGDLRGLEERFRVMLTVNADEEVGGQIGFVVDRGEQVMTIEQAKTLLAQAAQVAPLLLEEQEPEVAEDFEEDNGAEAAEGETAEAAGDIEEIDDGETADDQPAFADGESGQSDERPRDGRGRRRRRRRGRGGRGGEGREGGYQQPRHDQPAG